MVICKHHSAVSLSTYNSSIALTRLLTLTELLFESNFIRSAYFTLVETPRGIVIDDSDGDHDADDRSNHSHDVQCLLYVALLSETSSRSRV